MSLKVWLPLNGTLDNLGISNYTINAFRGSVVYDDNGKIGKCFNANGVNTLKILNIIPDFYNYPAYSLCVWCKATAQNTTHSGSGIISAGNWNNQVLNLAMSDWSSNHYTRLRISGTNWNKTYAYNFNLNTWYHIVVCCDGIKTYAYVNGMNIGNTADSFLPTSIEGNDICIGGATYYAGMQFFGKINDVRIYDHCLSAAEVKEIAQGLILHYKLNAQQLNNPTILTSEISNTAYNSSLGKYGYNNDSNLAKTTGIFQGKDCVKISTITSGQNAQPYVYFSNLFTSNGTNQPTYKKLTFEYYTTCPTTTWLNIYKLGSGTGTASWKTINSKGIHNGVYTNSESGHNLLVEPNEWNYVEVILNGDTDANAEWGYCINGPTHTSNANYYFLYANIKLEASNQLKIQDSSGYNHNGVSIGNLKIMSDTKRYDSSIKLNSSDPTTNNNTGLCYIQTPLALTTPSQMTVTWWGKPENGYGNSTSHAVFCTSNNETAPTDYNSTAFHHRDSGFDICPSDGSGVKRLSFTNSANAWHHYAVIYDGTTAKSYQDGIEKSNVTIGAGKTLASFSQLYIGFSKAGGVWRKTLGSYSDFRIYCTALLDTEIKQLYNVGMKVDKLGNIHTFAFEETIGNTQLQKTGVLNAFELNDDKYYDQKAKIGKKAWKDILHSNYYVMTTKDQQQAIGTVPTIPSTIVKSLAGKTLKFSYDVCTAGQRLSEETGETAWNKTRYGIHGSMGYTNAAGKTGTSYPFAGQLTYAGNATRVEQSWTIPTGYQTYGDLGWGVQPYDKPSSTNNNTWFISNVKLEVSSETPSGGWVSGTQLIER